MSPTFPRLLADALRAEPSRPLVTFYDDATGERVELSVTSYANWVAKTAGLFRDEYDLVRGDRLTVDLPTHWLGPVVLGAAWTVGLVVRAADEPRVPGLVVCGPAGVTAYDEPVLAISLHPLGGRFTEPLPAGVTDYGAVVLAEPDVFVADEEVADDDPAFGTATQADLVAEARGLLEPGGRLLTDVNPCTHAGARTVLAPLLAGGGAVWVANPAPERWAPTYAEERATAQLRS